MTHALCSVTSKATMPTLSDHINVYDTAIDTLTRSGYQVWYDESSDLYYAEINGWDFASATPVGLLGLVSIYERLQPAAYREYWWKSPNVGLLDSLPRRPLRPYSPVFARKK